MTGPAYHGRTHGPDGTDPIPGMGGGAGAPKLEAWSVPGALSTFTGPEQEALEDGEIDYVHLEVSTAPTGSGLTVVLKLNGSTIGTGTIAAGTKTVTFVPSPTAFVAGDVFRIDCTAIGSTVPGSDLLVRPRTL